MFDGWESGSLMFDGWESGYGCVRRELAELAEYRRVFGKKSVKNGGTRECPGLRNSIPERAGVLLSSSRLRVKTGLLSYRLSILHREYATQDFDRSPPTQRPCVSGLEILSLCVSMPIER